MDLETLRHLAPSFVLIPLKSGLVLDPTEAGALRLDVVLIPLKSGLVLDQGGGFNRQPCRVLIPLKSGLVLDIRELAERAAAAS